MNGHSLKLSWSRRRACDPFRRKRDRIFKSLSNKPVRYFGQCFVIYVYQDNTAKANLRGSKNMATTEIQHKIITYGQALHLAQTAHILVSNLKTTVQSESNQVYSGSATIDFLFVTMPSFSVGIEFLADLSTQKVSDITVGHGDDQSLFITVTQKETEFNFPFVHALEEIEDQTVIGALETQSLLIDLSPFVGQGVIDAIKKQTELSFLNDHATTISEGSTLVHYKGCIWIAKDLVEFGCGNVFVKQDNGDFRVLAFLMPSDVEKHGGVIQSITKTVEAQGSAYMLDEDYKELKGKLHDFTAEEIAEYITMDQQELQHEYN